MDTIKLNIVTPEGSIFSGDVQMVTLPGGEGELGVLPGHVDTVTLLKPGAIDIVKKSGKREMVAVNWGYVKIDEANVDVLADGAVAIEGSEESEIVNSISDAKKLLEAVSDDNFAYGSVVSRIETAAKEMM